MMMKAILIISIVYISQGLAQSGCGIRHLSGSRVVSGQTARPHSWPWQVSLRRPSSGGSFHFCGGSLVNNQWVVTAAHCVNGRQPSYLYVALGKHNFDANEAHQIDRNVERIIVHPRYSTSTINNDVALLKLTRPVSLKPQVSPVCLPNQGASVDETTGRECYITGWGRLAHNRPGAKVLQEAKMPVISNTKCRQHMGNGVTQQMVCAGFGGSSTVSGCMGDSGGPFVCREPSSDRWYLHGAVSWGSRTCSAGQNQFTVFARISEFVNWIKQYVGGVKPPPLTPRPSAENCNFDKGSMCGLKNLKGDQFDWELRRGSTPSGGTGPISDHSGNGYYLYTEASVPRRKGDKALLSTPYLSNAQCLKLFYNMYGQKMGTLNVKISTTGKFLYTISGDQGSGWKSLEIPISQQGNYQVIFEGIIGDGYQSDIAIDDITFTPGLCQSKPTDQPVRPTQPVQTQPPSQTVECNFDHENTCSFTNAKNDTFDWIVISGATPSSGTGPSRDVSGAGSYAYIEASSPRRLGDLAKLVSPKIPAGYRCLKFRYHMNGRNMGTLTVYLDNSEIFKQSRSQGNKWIKQEISIESQSSYKVVFEGKRGNGWQGDIAIDEVSIAPGKCSSTGTSRPPIPTTSGSKPPSGSCGQKGPGLSDFPKIVGGQQANPGEWPWQVSLLRGSFPFCGGSIVSNQYVITAAHCVKAKDWSKIKVRIGEHDLGKTEGHEKDISIARNGIIVHPNYNSRRTDYDIAIIKLSTTIQHTRMVKPVCINRGTDFTGQRCYITGWGRLRSGGSTPKILQEAQVPIVTNAECKKAYGSRITDRMFCAGYSKGGIDTCQGDSGGPLVCKHRDGSWHLTGLTSWGKGCASAGYYGVYAHVANLYSWVNQVTGL